MSHNDASTLKDRSEPLTGIDQLTNLLKRHGAGAVLVFEAKGLDPSGDLSCLELANRIQDLLGPQGLLVVPTCTPAEGMPKPTFDPILSPSEMGWFSEQFRSLPGVFRSNNATHSLAARGAGAEQFVAGHRFVTGWQTPWGESAFGIGSPWDRLYSQDALWVMVNPDWAASPFTSFLRALYWQRQQGVTRTTPFPDFEPATFPQQLEQAGIGTAVQWGPHPLFIFHTRPAVDTLLDELVKNPDAFGPSSQLKQWIALRQEIEQNGLLRAGAGKAKITPSVPFTRWEGRRITGIGRDLFARAIVFADDHQTMAVVLCDLIGLNRDLVSGIRRRAHLKTGLPEDAILIACTHSHSTPDTIAAGFEDPAYLDPLVEMAAEAVHQAAGSLQPVRLGWQQVPIRGLARSRRQKMPGGRVFTTRYGVPSTWRVNPALVVGEGPIDPDLTVLRIERLDGEILAAIANFGCHASVALTSNNCSGDYPGESMAALESILGEGALALCTNGAAADVDPTLEMPYWGPRTDASARRLGRIYAAQILETLERVPIQERSGIKWSRILVDVPVREDWIRLMESEQERMQQEYAANWVMSPSTAQILKEKVIHTEVQAVRLGELTFVAFPGEVFVETSRRLKLLYPGRPLAVIELANDMIGYIPPRQAFAEGGYECGQHFAARVPAEAEEILFEAARQAIDQV